MIINFSVENFYSIKNKITLSFEAIASDELNDYYIIEPKTGLRLLKLGILFGANASGKTSVLKALNFLKKIVLEPLSKKTANFDYKPFLFDANTPNQSTFFRLEFIQNGVRFFYEIELNRVAVLNEKLYFYKPNKALVYKRETDYNQQLTRIEFGSKIKINKEHKAILEANTLWNNSVLGGYLKTNFASQELQAAINWFENKLQSLIVPQTDLLSYVSNKLENQEIDKQHIVAFLKKADLKITDIIIKKQNSDLHKNVRDYIAENLPVVQEALASYGNQKKLSAKEIFFQHSVKGAKGTETYILPYNYESQGTQRYYQFSGLLDLMIRNETIFSIDELEASLHPDLLKHFLLTFLVNAKQSQLIVTSHHRELLMERDIFRNDVIWFTEKQEDGGTDLFSLTDFDSSVVRNTSSIYNAYKIGKLGAVPDLDDYYIDLNG